MKRREQPMAWCEAVRAGDDGVRDRFVESHLDLVRYLALRIAARLPSSVDVDDLIHDGVLGLLDAVQRFDPGRDVTFRTYAETRVRGAILDSLRRKDWRPRSLREQQRALDEAIGRLAAGGRSPSEDEIAREMGLPLDEYRRLLQDLRHGQIVPLPELFEEGVAAAEAGGPHATLERHDLADALADEIRALPERERRVLELYYHEELNMKEIGAVLGVTESRICQLHAQAAGRLRERLNARLQAGGASGEASARRRASG